MEEDFCDAAEFEARVAAEIIRPTPASLNILRWVNRHYPVKLLHTDKRWCNWKKDGLPFYRMLLARLVVEEAMDREAISGKTSCSIPEQEIHLARDVAEFEASVAACAAKNAHFRLYYTLNDEHKYWCKHLYCRLQAEGEIASWHRMYCRRRLQLEFKEMLDNGEDIPPLYIELRRLYGIAGTTAPNKCGACT